MRKILGLLFASTLLACTAAPPPTGELDSPVLAKSTGFRWTNPIDYEWDSSVTSSMQSDIVTGLQQYTDLTTLTFHHGIEPGRPHIQYTVQNPYGGNGSYTDPVDPTTGTTIHFAPSISARSVVHETGHALGLSHEQKRPDAANTVSYDINCAVEPTQFATLTGSDVETFGPYDIDSVMEYSSEQGCVKTASGTGGVNNTGCVCFPLVTKGHSHTSMSGYIPLSPQLSIEDINGLWHMYGPKLGKSEEGDKLGAAFAVGDFDHDGYDDLAVGAPGEAPGSDPQTGVVYLYKGTWEGLVPWMKLQESDWGVNLHDGDGFGSHLLAADIDGDGVTDLLVAAPSAAGIDSARGGAVFHYQGYARGGLVTRAWYDQESTRLGTNENGDLFGSALAAGDFDGDGKLDVAVGAPGETPGSHPKSGYVFLLRGSGFDILVGWQGVDEGALASDVAGDDFGWSVAAGDLDFDGKAELIVGAPGKTNGAGAAFIFRGGASAMQPQAMLTGPGTPAAADAYGKAVAVGAFDGVYIGATRRLELAIGAPGRAGSGRVYLEDVVFDGSLTNVQRIKTIDQSMVGWDNDAGDNFGSVLAVADPNRDLADDLVVGVPAKHARGVDGNGAVELFAGSSSSSWMTGWTAYAQPQDGTLSADDHFGSAVGVGYFRGQIPPGLVAGVSGKHVGGVASGAFVEFAGVNGAAPAFAQTVTEDVQLRQ